MALLNKFVANAPKRSPESKRDVKSVAASDLAQHKKVAKAFKTASSKTGTFSTRYAK